MAEQKYKNGLVERLEIHKNSQTELAEQKYKNGLIERLENHKNDQAEQTEYKYKGIKRQSRPKRNSRKRICRETHKVEGTKDSLDAILSVNNQNVNDTVNFDTVMDIGETMSQSNIYPKMQYFPNDNLPTIIDLSQLTLTLDSELIFPS